MKEFPDATVLFYAWGSFDKWCVFEGNAHNLNRAKPLRDIEYFKQIKWLAKNFPMNSLFADKLYKVAAEKAHYFSGGMEGGLMTCKMCMFVV